MNNSNASKVGYFLQRLSGMPFAQTYQYANPKSLIVVTGVVSGVLIGVNELLVWGLSRVDQKQVNQAYNETVPRMKPDFIVEWEQKYGSKKQ